MQFDLLADLTDEMRVQAIQHVTHTFYLLETCLFLVQFLYLIIQPYDFLLQFLVIGQVTLSKLYEIVCLSVGFISPSFELR